MTLMQFGMRFENDFEPNVWDVIPEVHISDYGLHYKCMPWFARKSDTHYQGLNWEIVTGGFISFEQLMGM